MEQPLPVCAVLQLGLSGLVCLPVVSDCRVQERKTGESIRMPVTRFYVVCYAIGSPGCNGERDALGAGLAD